MKKPKKAKNSKAVPTTKTDKVICGFLSVSRDMFDLPVIDIEGKMFDPMPSLPVVSESGRVLYQSPRELHVFDFIVQKAQGLWTLTLSTQQIKAIRSYHARHAQHADLVLLHRVEEYQAWAVAKIITVKKAPDMSDNRQVKIQVCSAPTVDYRGSSAPSPKP